MLIYLFVRTKAVLS